MNSTSLIALAAGALTALMIAATPAVAAPETVSGPSADPECFAPNETDAFFCGQGGEVCQVCFWGFGICNAGVCTF